MNLETIKKIWKYKLTKNFINGDENFNLYIDSPFCIAPICKYCIYKPTIISDKSILKLKNKYYSEILLNNIKSFSDIISIRLPDAIYFGGEPVL